MVKIISVLVLCIMLISCGAVYTDEEGNIDEEAGIGEIIFMDPIEMTEGGRNPDKLFEPDENFVIRAGIDAVFLDFSDQGFDLPYLGTLVFDLERDGTLTTYFTKTEPYGITKEAYVSAIILYQVEKISEQEVSQFVELANTLEETGIYESLISETVRIDVFYNGNAYSSYYTPGDYAIYAILKAFVDRCTLPIYPFRGYNI